MKKASNWKPEFPKSDDRKVNMCSNAVQTFSVSREVGVMITEDVEKQSPACFWVDEKNVFLRMNWGTWYKVSTDSPETVSAICRRHTAKLTQIVGNCSKDCFIPVFHLDRLPAEIFDGVPGDDGGGEEVPPSKEERTRRARERLVARMIDRMGEVVGKYRKGEGEFVLIRSEQGLLLVSFFADSVTEWLADEESFCGDPPQWFSETSHLQSPLHAVGQAAKYLKTEYGIDSIPVVILDDAIDIINREDMSGEWRKTGVLVCYCRREEDGIPAFDPGLLAGRGEEPDDPTVAAAQDALGDYEAMPSEDRESALREFMNEDPAPPQDDREKRRYCLGKYHSDEPCGDFMLTYDFHRLRLLPDESSEFTPTGEALKEIARMISEAGVYSDFGLKDRDLPDDPDEARLNAEAADRLFIRMGGRGKKPPYDGEHNASLKDWLVQIERFWRCGNPIALRDVGLTETPLWSLVFETKPAALIFQYPDGRDWLENTDRLLEDYVEEYTLAAQQNPELTILCVVIVESCLPEELHRLNATTPPDMFFVAPEELNETVMKIFMERVFGDGEEADDPEKR